MWKMHCVRLDSCWPRLLWSRILFQDTSSCSCYFLQPAAMSSNFLLQSLDAWYYNRCLDNDHRPKTQRTKKKSFIYTRLKCLWADLMGGVQQEAKESSIHSTLVPFHVSILSFLNWKSREHILSHFGTLSQISCRVHVHSPVYLLCTFFFFLHWNYLM
jgi:hypothetical protein